MKVSAVQFSPVWENKNENISKAKKLLEKHLSSSDLIVFPETFLSTFTMNSDHCSEEQNGTTESLLFDFSAMYQAATVGGWIEKNLFDKPYNTASFTEPRGNIYRYRKIHPFTFANEDKNYSSGNTSVSFEYKGFKIALFICYDLRFPESFRSLAGNTDLYIVIANWPQARIDHWLTLLKARAIENQAYVLGVNRTGEGGGLVYNGNSCLFDTWGENLFPITSEETILSGTISLDHLTSIRQKYPFLKDRFV
jgi:omega-amidase